MFFIGSKHVDEYNYKMYVNIKYRLEAKKQYYSGCPWGEENKMTEL